MPSGLPYRDGKVLSESTYPGQDLLFRLSLGLAVGLKKIFSVHQFHRAFNHSYNSPSTYAGQAHFNLEAVNK